MTEQDWLQSNDPEAMLLQVRGVAGARELRLFACACCRRIWHLLSDERSRNAVEMSERYASGQASAEDLRLARTAAKDVLKRPHGINIQAARAAVRAAAQDPVDSSDTLLWYAVRVGARAARAAVRNQVDTEVAAQADLLREMLGNRLRMPGD